jgi:predicted transcriptional regulator
MARRELEFDEETDRLLSEIADGYEGDASRALTDLIHAHQSLESFVDQCEEEHGESLAAQLGRGERGFEQGRFTTWDEIKRRNGL